MKIIFKINITKEYQIQCSFIDSNNKEIPIQIPQNGKEYVNLIINENKGTISFLKEMIEHPEEYVLSSITFQQEEYKVISEILFALFVDEYKQKIEKEYIIEETIVEVPTNNFMAIKRIQIALESIGLQNIEFNPLVYDYTEQGNIFQKLQEKKNSFKKYQQMINKGERISQVEEQQKKLLTMKNEMVFTEEGFNRFYKCTSGIPAYVNIFGRLLPRNYELNEEIVLKEFNEKIPVINSHLVNIWTRLTYREQSIIVALLQSL